MSAKSHDKMLTTIAGNIRRIRLAKGMTQKQVAENMDKEKQAIQKIESGDINPRFLTLVEIAEALGVSVYDLLKGI